MFNFKFFEFMCQNPLKMAENVKIIEKDVAANGHD